MSNRNRSISIVNTNEELLSTWKKLSETLFGLKTSVKPEESKTRIHCYSMTLQHWLHNHFDIKINYAAPVKSVPALILKSPRSVVASFLRGLFDTDGCAVKQNGGAMVYISRSYELAHTVQHVLLRFGIICRVIQQKDLCFRLVITGIDAVIFAREIGFGVSHKQDIMMEMISRSKWRKKRRISTKIIEKIEDVGTTYDFSVDESHRYVSGPFRHHNCATYVHYRIMNRLHEKGLMTDGSMIEFLTSHTNVVFQPGFDDRRYSGINPYALGFAMMKDIERICREPTEEDRRWFPDIAGCNNEMVVLKDAWTNYRDESFVRQFLSPKVIRDFGLFRLTDIKTETEYMVTAIHDDSGYEKVRETLADTYERHASVPQIEVIKADPKSRNLSLRYRRFRGRDLAKSSAMVKHIQVLWGNTVLLYDEKDGIIV